MVYRPGLLKFACCEKLYVRLAPAAIFSGNASAITAPSFAAYDRLNPDAYDVPTLVMSKEIVSLAARAVDVKSRPVTGCETASARRSSAQPQLSPPFGTISAALARRPALPDENAPATASHTVESEGRPEAR